MSKFVVGSIVRIKPLDYFKESGVCPTDINGTVHILNSRFEKELLELEGCNFRVSFVHDAGLYRISSGEHEIPLIFTPNMLVAAPTSSLPSAFMDPELSSNPYIVLSGVAANSNLHPGTENGREQIVKATAALIKALDLELY